MQDGLPPRPEEQPSAPADPPPPGAPAPWPSGTSPAWPYGWPPPPRTGASSPWPVVAAVFVGIWAALVATGSQATAWLVDQVMLVLGLDQPAWLWPATSLLSGLLVGLPAVLLARLPRSAAVRAAGRVWLLGALVLGVLGLLRAIPNPLSEVYLAALAGSAALGAVLLRRYAHRVGRRAGDRAAGLAGIGVGAAAGLALLLPWVWLGALGGVLESVLALLAAAAVGRLTATILDPPFWAAYGRRAGDAAASATPPGDAAPTPDQPVGGAGLVLLGGLVAGVTLALVAAGVGQAGAQLALLLVLPPAGFAVAALAPGSGSASLGWLVGGATLGPLAFVDPEELTLLLATGWDVPAWTGIAAAASFGVAVLLGIGYGVAFGRARAVRPRRPLAAVLVAVLLLAVGGVYVGLGSPGWHGERLFVVLKEQAELTGVTAAPGPAGREARGREVYRRLVETAQRSQAGLRRELDRLHLDYTPYYLVNAVEVEGGAAVRAWLSRRDEVARVLVSQRLRPLPAPPDPMTGNVPTPIRPVWNVSMIGADRVWSELGVDGSGIVVGSSDSGVDGTHPALSANFRGGNDSWYDPWNATRTPTDRGGHGTHTLGTAVGGQHVGVAPGARWVGCVNLDRNLGNPAHYLDCLQFMLAPFPPGGDPFTDGRPERAPQVLNNSWGCPPIEGCAADTLRPATAALAAAGIFFVAAAGNTGPFCASIDDPPAPHPDAFTVGAVDRRGRLTDFSSRGPVPGAAKPDLVAPGDDVLSALPGGGYAALGGTSMAAPHVAGVVALMWSANPLLVGDVTTTARILRDTAAPAGPADPDDACGPEANRTGAGVVDAYAAVRAAQEVGR